MIGFASLIIFILMIIIVKISYTQIKRSFCHAFSCNYNLQLTRTLPTLLTLYKRMQKFVIQIRIFLVEQELLAVPVKQLKNVKNSGKTTVS